MKNSAVVSTLTLVGSIALAAGQRSETNPLPADLIGAIGRIEDDQSPSQRSTRDGVVAQQLDLGQCVIGEPLNWFTTVRRLPACYGELWAGTLRQRTTVDVDGDDVDDLVIAMKRNPDGINEVADWMSYWSSGGSDGSTGGNCCPGEWTLFVLRATVVGQETQLSFRPVMSSLPVNEVIGLMPPDGLGNQEVHFTALHDVDGDGDRDLIVNLRYLDSTWIHRRLWAWIENVAVAGQPLTADLNQDGNVDGADLGILLNSWGAQP